MEKSNYSALIDVLNATSSKSTPKKYSKENIQTYIDNPYRHHDKLRQTSDWFYNSSGIYKMVINAFANLPTLDNIIIPSKRTLEKLEDKAYKLYLGKVTDYTESINMKLTTREMLKSIAKYGAYIGYERSNGKDFYIQTLPIDYCRIKYKIGNEYQLEFNFKYFDRMYQKEDLDLAWSIFPSEFKKLHNKYKNDNKSKNPEWQMIDFKKTFCILYDEDEAVFIPPFLGMFTALLDADDYQNLTLTGKKLDIIKMVVQQVPLDDDGNIQMDKEEIAQFHQKLKQMLPDGVVGFTTPMEIKDVSFSSVSKEKEDLLDKAERNIFLNSGFSSSLFSDSGGNVGLNMNIETVTANVFAILEKIEHVFNRKFVGVVNSRNYDFILKFFRTTNINIDDNFERQYKLLSVGGSLLILLSLSGIDPETYVSLLTIENKLGIKDLLEVPQSMHTQTGNEEVGTPKKKEKDLTDEGVKTRKTDGNNPKNRK